MQLSYLSQSIQKALQQTLEEITDVLEKNNREKDSLQLLIVSKTYSFEYIIVAKDCGMILFGENKVQEFIKKKQDYAATYLCNVESLIKNVKVHLIGTLQTNKVGKALQHFSCIQSIDSLSLLEKICMQLKKQEQSQENELVSEQKAYTQPILPYPIYLQIRCSRYDYKHGFDTMDLLLSAVEFCMQQKKYINLQGLMTIAPLSNNEKIVREGFAQTRKWAEHAWNHFGITQKPELSMGMSNDFYHAIAEGSTLLRLGSKIFGIRK